MIDIEAQLLGQDTGWREVLEAYRPVETEDQEEVSTDSLGDESFEELAAPETGEDEVRLADLSGDDSDDGNWLPRVTSLEGIEDERLSRIHGRLIALGWLGFDVAGRDVGLRYRMTLDGRRVLDGVVPAPTLHVLDETVTTAIEG
ncbi:MAG: hypothetical protein CMJ65_04040 [Planctomycetaceae bacterium]|jgi:hypothetical protein|nr:hypothetical protein [Planctomycetaceae bacterium]MDP7274397.1 hypothetical protein [Planctomycetaceae bacterium]